MASGNDGLFVWYEYLASDPKSATTFFGEVVGWKAQPFTGAGEEYTVWTASQGPLGGVMKLPDEVVRAGVSSHWLGYVQVADVDATLAVAQRLGARVCKEPEDVPTIGRFAILADPQGAILSIYKPASPTTLNDPAQDGEFCWNELTTSDGAAAAEFYTKLLGWKILDEMDMGPMGTYRIFGVGERRLGGMMTAPPGVPAPPAWLYYASTSDLDGALGRATHHGAKVVNGPMDVPGGGRIAQLVDPQGGAFALHQRPKA